jgi:uncharacterized membrane protein
MTEPVSGSEAPRMAVRMKWLLIGSLTVNLLVAGIVAGVAFEEHGRLMGPGADGVSFGPFTEALSHEDRKALRDAFVRRMPNFRDERKEARADAAAMLAALRTEPLDAGALRAAFDAQRARIAARVDLGQDLLLERIGTMSAEARSEFAEHLEAVMRDIKRGGKGDVPSP